MNISCLTECDVLATSAFISKQIADCVDDQDTLELLGDLITAIGDNVTLIAGQRERFEKNCQSSMSENNLARENTKL